jgi:hypothetical protein
MAAEMSRQQGIRCTLILCTSILIHTYIVAASDLPENMAKLEDKSSDMTRSESAIRFNNPKMFQNSLTDGENVDGVYEFDTTQEDVDVTKFGGSNIRSEARTLSMCLRQLSNNEMKVTNIQVRFR